jgi:hypothetical protein
LRYVTILAKLAISAVGYAAAVFVAAVTTLSLIMLPTVLPDKGAWGSFYGYTRDLPMVMLVACAVTFLVALPVFLVMLVIAATSPLREWRHFAVAGCFDAAASHVIFGFYAGAFMPFGYVIASLPGGFAGGFTYWALAGRFLACERDRTTA